MRKSDWLALAARREATAAQRVDAHFRLYYRRPLDEYEITDTPGYWQRKEPCGGRGNCSSVEAHMSWGWENGFRHTATYYDPQTRDPATGRWLSPHRTWRELHEAAR